MKRLLYLLLLTCSVGNSQILLIPSKPSLTVERFEGSRGTFELNSNIAWTITSPQPWLFIWICEVMPQPDGSNLYTQFFSGNAPDIGAFEFLENDASGVNKAIVVVQAQENKTGVARTSVVTVTGPSATTQKVTVTQQALEVPQSTLGKMIKSFGKLIIK